MIVPDVNLLGLRRQRGRTLPRPGKGVVGSVALRDGSGGTRLECYARLSAGGVESPDADRPGWVERALYRCRKWLTQPRVHVPLPGPDRLDVLADLLRGPTAVSALAPEAHLAALAIEHQTELNSTDSDSARFSGLRWRNPVA